MGEGKERAVCVNYKKILIILKVIFYLIFKNLLRIQSADVVYNISICD